MTHGRGQQGGIDCRNRGYRGQRRPMGENWDNCNRTTINKNESVK